MGIIDFTNPGTELEMAQPIEVENRDQPKYQHPAGKEANVALAASAESKALPAGMTNIGQVGIVIPDKKGQLSGFYTEHAGTLVAQYPQYKFIQKKGEKNAQSITIK